MDIPKLRDTINKATTEQDNQNTYKILFWLTLQIQDVL